MEQVKVFTASSLRCTILQYNMVGHFEAYSNLCNKIRLLGVLRACCFGGPRNDAENFERKGCEARNGD